MQYQSKVCHHGRSHRVVLSELSKKVGNADLLGDHAEYQNQHPREHLVGTITSPLCVNRFDSLHPCVNAYKRSSISITLLKVLGPVLLGIQGLLKTENSRETTGKILTAFQKLQNLLVLWPSVTIFS